MRKKESKKRKGYQGTKRGREIEEEEADEERKWKSRKEKKKG